MEPLPRGGHLPSSRSSILLFSTVCSFRGPPYSLSQLQFVWLPQASLCIPPSFEGNMSWLRVIVFCLSIAFGVSWSSCFPLPISVDSSSHEIIIGDRSEGLAMADASPFQGVHLHHFARETSDVNRMVEFYQQVLGFKKLETPESFGDFNVTWLRLPPIYQLHVVERDPNSRLPESPFVVPSDANADVSALWRGPHLSFRVSDYDAAINTLKLKDVKYFEKTQQDGKVKQCFFFDPDGNGLEIGNWPVPK